MLPSDGRLPIPELVALHCIVCILSWKEYGFCRHRSCRRNDGPANGNEEVKSSASFVCYLFGSDMYMLDKYLHSYIDRRGSGDFPDLSLVASCEDNRTACEYECICTQGGSMYASPGLVNKLGEVAH
jgi:hypothetical protein